ncbi:cell division protein ZapD [Pleionea sediminis]|uniref:cell division protein ZapD n=1 Tax=Pleionea sediminis TaxID=2569479 RepID=UPI001185D5AD|nr:cell division protein ZapD [Pleionea sediminis]
MVDNYHYFEFPLSQNYRQLLRLENTFSHFERLIRLNTEASNEASLLCIVNLLEYLSRIDMKTELIRELEAQTHQYEKLKSNPAVDVTKLENFLEQLAKLHQWAINYRGRLGDDLRQQPLIKNILTKQSLHTGVSSCDSPELSRFCRLSADKAKSYIEEWYHSFEGLKTSVSVILRLTRELSSFETGSAPMGDFLIEKPNPGNTLLRIRLSKHDTVFPEVSAGKHRISIHFYYLDDKLTKLKCRKAVNFKYATCGWKESL